MNKNLPEISLHLLLWFFIFINLFNYTLVEENNSIEAFIAAMFIIVIIAIPFYFNYFFLADLIFIKKKYLHYLVLLTLIIIGTYFLLNLTSSTWLLEDEEAFSGGLSIITNLLFIIVFSNLLKGIFSWFQVQQKKTQLEKEKLQSELNFLKLQINPHFLFNSLNNIYSLCYKKSDTAAPMIAKLSKILRYLIYDCQEAKVFLSKEIDMLKNFIDLNMLKIGEERNIDFYTEGIENNHKIAPLILITYLENAFKHGNIVLEKTAWINIQCIVEDNIMEFNVSNSFTDNIIVQKDIPNGIGLINTKKQLELIYQDKYTLDITQGEKEYKVSLRIEIKE